MILNPSSLYFKSTTKSSSIFWASIAGSKRAALPSRKTYFSRVIVSKFIENSNVSKLNTKSCWFRSNFKSKWKPKWPPYLVFNWIDTSERPLKNLSINEMISLFILDYLKIESKQGLAFKVSYLSQQNYISFDRSPFFIISRMSV